MNKNEPIRHHYIPKFLINNFADKNQYVYFYNKVLKKEEIYKSSEIFYISNLYRNDKNKDDPTKLEHDLAKIESDAKGIVDKMLAGRDIIITFEELDKIKIFLWVMAFRQKGVKETFKKANQDFKDAYSYFQKDGDLVDYWQRNLDIIVRSKNLQEALKDKDLALPMKTDILDFSMNYYLSIVERRGKEDFILGDVYPLWHNFGIFYYPISAERMILVIPDGIEKLPMETVKIDLSRIYAPKGESKEKRLLRYHVGLMKEQDVSYINYMFRTLAQKGFVYKDQKRVKF